ncbi:MAG: 2Fe-2S iron-sulfur cluster binding domain-containing protein [Proteobacteria bacterium]|nr:2Fe-2S iron-sulfur cluster binding domain-containing protein [Pseudomonadota bacterium]
MTHHVTLAASGKRFDVREGETVLEAAQRAGLALSYSCLAGVCGSCKATLIEGRCGYPRNPPTALSDSELAHDAVLLCQAVPRSDLVIAAREVASVEDLPRRTLDVRVVARELLSRDVMRLELAPVGAPLRWLPGQYADVLLDDGRRRAFSIARAPHLGPNLELHVRRVAGGDFTNFVFDGLREGGTLRVEGPLGTFVPREDSERPMLFVAGGAGFAPVKALVEHFLHLHTRRPMRLYRGARGADDLYLRELPQTWRRDARDFDWRPVLSDPEAARRAGMRAGFVHEAVLQDEPDLSAFDVYMSGPPAMIDAGRRLFVEAGLPEDRLYYDSFDYAPDVLAQILGNRAGIHGF